MQEFCLGSSSSPVDKALDFVASMEEGSFRLSQPGAVTTSAKSTTVLDDDYMELVFENGQIVTRGPRKIHNLPALDQNRVPLQLQDHGSKSMRDYHEMEYDKILEPKRSNRITKNLADTQIVPGHENTNQDAGFSSQRQHNREQDKVNFSMFLRPQNAFRANNNGSDSKPVESTLIDTANCSKNTRNGQNQQSMDGKTEMKLVNVASMAAYVPDEQSAAVGGITRLEEKQNCDGVKPTKPVASSACSREASNSYDPTYTLRKKYDETEGSESQTYNSEEESEDMRTQVPAHVNRGAKRKRVAEYHNLSERRRRDKISKKMRDLQELIPNSNKVDKVSMLDEAITYMKTLQLQLQMMSMGSGLFTPPMMLPLSIPQMNTLNLAHYPSMGFGMNTGMHSGIGFDPTQYMLGFAGQTMPMAVSCPPFFSVSENYPAQSVPVPSASVPQDLQKSASFPSLYDAMQQRER